MFARYQDILAGQVDEDGMGINNVGKALERVGISIRDVDGGFRDFSAVLDDLYPKWQSLNEVEQANILKALAGVRQRESLLVLLENETKYRKALTETMNSEGLAAERYAVYLDSVEAAQNRLTASWEKLVMSSATGDMIVNLFDATSGALDLVDALGGIPTILKVVIPLLVIFNAELIATNYNALGQSILNLGTSLKGLQGALLATKSAYTAGLSATTALEVGFGTAAVAATAFVLAIGSVIAVLYTYNEQVSKTQKAGLEKNISVWDKIFSDISKNGTNATEILEKYKQSVDAINKSHEEAGIIADIFVDKQAMIDEGLKQSIPLLEENTDTLQEYKKSIQELAETSGYMIDEQGRFYKIGSQGLRFYADGIDTLTDAEWRAKYASEALTTQIQGEKEVYDEAAISVGGLATEYVGFVDTLKALSSNLDTMGSLMEESMAGTLDFSDVTKIPEGYLDALTVEGDKLKLNISLIKEKQLAEAKMSYDAVLLAQARGDATAQEVAVISLYYNKLLAESQATYGAFGQTAWAYDELLWKLANDAYASGVQIANMEGQALTSAQSIYEYLASGDEAFNSFVQQAAIMTGQSVEQVMQQINGMIQTTANNAAELINYLGASSLGVDSGFNRAPTAPTFSDSLFTGVDLNSNPFVVGGGGGGYSQQVEDLEEISDIEDEILDTENDIEDARNEAEESLRRQLELYKEIIEEKKRLLDEMLEERNYNEDVEDKNKEISRVMAELTELQLDDSEAANARRQELQEELANLQDDLEDMQFEHSIDTQQEALDQEYNRFEDIIEAAIQKIQGIQATSTEDFAAQLAEILLSVGNQGGGGGGVDDSWLRSPSRFPISMNANNSYDRSIPNFSQANLSPSFAPSSSAISGEQNLNAGSITIQMPIQVAGNLDKSVLPDLDKLANKMLDKINDQMKQRGYNRRADLFQI